MRTRRMLAALVTVAALLTLAAGGAADDTALTAEPRGLPLGSDFRISGALATAQDSQPAVGWNQTNNEYLVVWMDRRYASTRGTDIAAQPVSAAGVSLGLNFAVSGLAATGNESLPAVAWNQTDNEYLVVGADNRNWNTRGVDIVGQRVSASGRRLRANFLISGPGATEEEAQPSVAWNAAANEYLVVWQDRRNQSTSESDIYAQRLSAAGVRLGDDVRLSGPVATSNERDAAVVWNPRRNEYLVVWEDARNGGYTSSDIYGRWVAANGRRRGDDFRVSGLTWSVGGLLPLVAWNAKLDKYLVVWQDRRNESASDYEIHGQESSGRGRLLEGSFRISGAAATGYDGAPGIAYNETLNQYLVVWEHRRDPSRDFDIWGRRVGGQKPPAGRGEPLSVTRLPPGTLGNTRRRRRSPPARDWGPGRSSSGQCGRRPWHSPSPPG